MKHLVLLASLLLAFPVFAQDEPEPVQGDAVLPYLEQSISWKRTIDDTESLAGNARELILKDKVRASAAQALQKSFEFARAQATLTPPASATANDSQPDTQTRRARLLKANADADKRVADLQAQLKRSNLTRNAREKLNGDLKLARAQQDLLQTVLRIFNNEGDHNGTLIDQVNALANTALDEPQTTADSGKNKEVTAVTVKTAPQVPVESVRTTEGMYSLLSLMFTLSRKEGELNALLRQSDALKNTNRDFINAIRAELRTALSEGNALTTGAAKDLDAYHKSLDGLLLRYRQLSATVIPLGQMNVLMESAERNLQEWQQLVHKDWNNAFRKLLLRLVILSVAIAIPLLLSDLARRAIRRYVQDQKRRKQLRIVRRIVLGLMLLFVVVVNFTSEFGSLATFAGFITAGLAVALQTVLVSLVAHFFFFGRYGIRAGDRITVADVTGDVLQIGMLRIYIRELEAGESGYTPTGKLVAFPNSILFQPTAFYKHMDV